MKRAASLVCWLALACVLCVTAPAQAERRLALVIGNASYPTAPLRNPVNDARSMAAELRSLGFEVRLLLNATKRDMADAAREFGAKLNGGGVGLFYYAGHGMQIKGENFLVPVDAKLENEADAEFECLEANRLLRYMETAKNELNIIILDACRNNPFAHGSRSAAHGLAQMDAPMGSLIAFGTSPGAVASDGDGKNGLYTQSLLRYMKQPGLSLTDVFMRVRQDVVLESEKKQVPWESSSITGYFYFAGKPKDTAQASTEEAARLNQEKERLAQEKRDLETKQLNLRREQAQIDEAKRKLTQPKTPAATPTQTVATGSAPKRYADMPPASASLAEKLRGWRATKADAEHLPVYMILTNDQIRDIASKMPTTPASLSALNGMEMRAERYGSEIIAIVRSFAPPPTKSKHR